MELLTYPLLAFAPGVFWFWFFTRKDTYRPEPKRLIARTFFLGMLSTIPAGILNDTFFDDSVMDEGGQLSSIAMSMLFVVGPIEETSKFLAVYLVAYRSLYFDEPSDGLVHASAASLGFASLENLQYILEFGPAVMIGRAPLSTVAHVIFGSFWGNALSKQTQADSRGMSVITGIAAALVHGSFNFFLFASPFISIALVILGIWWTLRRFNWALLVSPFRYRRNYPRIACSECNSRISAISRYCQACGVPVKIAVVHEMYCSNCGIPNHPKADFCTHCGDKFLRRL